MAAGWSEGWTSQRTPFFYFPLQWKTVGDAGWKPGQIAESIGLYCDRDDWPDKHELVVATDYHTCSSIQIGTPDTLRKLGNHHCNVSFICHLSNAQ